MVKGRKKFSSIVFFLRTCILFMFLILLFLLSSCSMKSMVVGDKPLDKPVQIAIPDDYFADEFIELTKSFTEESGIELKLNVLNADDYYDVLIAEFENRSTKYDVVVYDSYWIGKFVHNGYVVQITKWLDDRSISFDLSKKYISYLVEYPLNSGKVYGVPLQFDLTGYAYRKDLFDDASERKNFESKYGYELSIPKDYSQLLDIVDFFDRSDIGLHGIGVASSDTNSDLTLSINPILHSFGGSLGDMENYVLLNYLNSYQSIEALEYYLNLYQYSPESLENSSFDDVVLAFSRGEIAIAYGSSGQFRNLQDPSFNRFADDTGYFMSPAGPSGKYSALSGYTASLIAFSKNKDNSLEFLEWFVENDTQKKWASLGGTPFLFNVLQSEEFINRYPYNKELFEVIYDCACFWRVPDYFVLLEIFQSNVLSYLKDMNRSAEGVLNAILLDWEQVFEEGGYFGS